jgi:hypothetical protein
MKILVHWQWSWFEKVDKKLHFHIPTYSGRGPKRIENLSQKKVVPNTSPLTPVLCSAYLKVGNSIT